MRFLLQSLVAGVGAAIDNAALVGSGVMGQPLGAYNSAGVATITFGAAATLAKVANIFGQIETAKGGVDGDPVSIVLNPAVKEKWLTIQRWTGASVALYGDDDRVLGRPAFITTSMGASDLLAGQFNKMVIAFFGSDIPVQLLADPFSESREGRIRVVAEVLADTGLLRPTCFVKNADSAVQ